MNTPTHWPIAEALLKVTDNPANSSGWVDRMALLMMEAGIPRSSLEYEGSPQTVARRWVKYVEMRGQLANLQATIWRWEQRPQETPITPERQEKLDALAARLRELGRSETEVEFLVNILRHMTTILDSEVARIERHLAR